MRRASAALPPADSLRRFSFALRKSPSDFVAEDPLPAFSFFFESAALDEGTRREFLALLQMDASQQRQRLARDSPRVFAVLLAVLARAEGDCSLLAYLLPWLDGILFGAL